MLLFLVQNAYVLLIGTQSGIFIYFYKALLLKHR